MSIYLPTGIKELDKLEKINYGQLTDRALNIKKIKLASIRKMLVETPHLPEDTRHAAWRKITTITLKIIAAETRFKQVFPQTLGTPPLLPYNSHVFLYNPYLSCYEPLNYGAYSPHKVSDAPALPPNFSTSSNMPADEFGKFNGNLYPPNILSQVLIPSESTSTYEQLQVNNSTPCVELDSLIQHIEKLDPHCKCTTRKRYYFGYILKFLESLRFFSSENYLLHLTTIHSLVDQIHSFVKQGKREAIFKEDGPHNQILQIMDEIMTIYNIEIYTQS